MMFISKSIRVPSHLHPGLEIRASPQSRFPYAPYARVLSIQIISHINKGAYISTHINPCNISSPSRSRKYNLRFMQHHLEHIMVERCATHIHTGPVSPSLKSLLHPCSVSLSPPSRSIDCHLNPIKVASEFQQVHHIHVSPPSRSHLTSIQVISYLHPGHGNWKPDLS